MERVLKEPGLEPPELKFRHRLKLPKKEINDRLANISPDPAKILFGGKSAIRPDGGIMEALDRFDRDRITLVRESGHRGNDVEDILKGTMQGKNGDRDLMTAGNVIERDFRSERWTADDMVDILRDVAAISLDVLATSLPKQEE